jgi:hypothetical protein
MIYFKFGEDYSSWNNRLYEHIRNFDFSSFHTPFIPLQIISAREYRRICLKNFKFGE